METRGPKTVFVSAVGATKNMLCPKIEWKRKQQYGRDYFQAQWNVFRLRIIQCPEEKWSKGPLTWHWEIKSDKHPYLHVIVPAEDAENAKRNLVVFLEKLTKELR